MKQSIAFGLAYLTLSLLCLRQGSELPFLFFGQMLLVLVYLRLGLGLKTLLVTALLARLLFWFLPASNDLQRYIFEGRLIQAGYNPYHTSFTSVEVPENLKSGLSPNHPDWPAIYPPVAQAFFYFVSCLAGSSVESFRIMIFLCDFALLGLLFKLLEIKGLPRQNLAFYALNPVILHGFCAQNHNDILMLFFVVLGLIVLELKKPILFWFFMVLGVGSKWLNLFILPAFLKGPAARNFFWGILFLGLLLFSVWSLDAWQNLLKFFDQLEYHSSPLAQKPWSFVFLLLWISLCFLLILDELTLALYLCIGWLLVSTTIHFWYLGLLAVLLCFRPVYFGIFWCASSGVWYFSYILEQKGLAWQEVWFADFWHYGIPLVMALFYWRLGPLSAKLPSVDVVIPVYRDHLALQSLLQDLSALKYKPERILIVDGEDSREVRNSARRAGALFLPSKPGRGFQISLGLQYASSPIVLILHADARIRSEIILDVARVMRDPSLAGGALGHVYQEKMRGLGLIFCLNWLKSKVFGMYFGNQGIFVRRHLLYANGPVLEQALMEDVELSFFLQRGRTVYLGSGLSISPRRWKAKGIWTQALMVGRLMLGYALLRRKQERVDTSYMNQLYYLGK